MALFIRVGYVLAIGKDTLTWGDELAYDQLAQNMLEHGCFCFTAGQPSVLRAPLYPWILAFSYYLFGRHYIAILLIQAVAGACCAPLLALIGKQITGSIWTGLLAAVMFILNPVLIFSTGLLYSETLYLLLLLAATYLWLKLGAVPQRWRVTAAASGVLFGWSLLMKPNLLLFPIWLLVWAWIVFRNIRRAVGLVACITLAAALVVLPWSIRNYAVTAALIPVSANTGLNLLQGNNDQVNGGALDVRYIDPLPQLSETARDDMYKQWAVEWIRGHPASFIRLIPLKLYKFFSPLETSNRGAFVTWASPFAFMGYGLFYLIAIIGMLQAWSRWRNWSLVGMLILYPTLMAIAFYGGTRYGLAVQPFLMLFAAEAVRNLLASAYASGQR